MTENLENLPAPENSASTTLPNNGDNVRASWQFSLHNVRTNMAHCNIDSKDVMISAFLWCIDTAHPVTRYEFAKGIGYSDSAVYKIFTGKYVNENTGERIDVPEKMVGATKQWLELQKERHQGKMEFILTPTAKRIFTSFDLARESQSPLFVTGPSQIGKTWASINYAARNNHGRTPYIRMKAASGLGGMVKRIVSKTGNSDNCNTADGVDRIKNSLTPNSLPLIDEVHLLIYTYRRESFFACMEVIREIIDEVGCGIAFIATKLLLDAMNSARNGEMQQLLRRGVHRLNLPDMPTKADLTAIFNHNALEFPEESLNVQIRLGKSDFIDKPRSIIRQLAKADGLKAITERLRYGRKLALKMNEPLDWKHFYHAHLLIEKQTQADADWD